MLKRILLTILVLLSFPCWSMAGPVHGAHGVVYGEYQLHVAIEPALAEPNAPARVGLTLTDPNGADVSELEPGAPFEVAIVRQGLDVFTRFRPSMGEGAALNMNLTFPVAGVYYVYVTFTPLSGNPVTARAEMRIEGDPPAPLPMEVHVPGRIVSETLGADISLERTNFGHRISLGLLQPDGSPLTDVDPASGDLVILSADGTEYFHGSPVQSGNATTAVFEAVFPSPGLYKAWALYQGGGKLLELPFVMDIRD